ncbi:hypothetical protein Atai01_45630 [Amycolatopsis taiwanensis]|uniref:Uncharacterized protein n=1 Tax=Amycolatopsis taiwanensis TaxID=342230 RepID=A0A9W6VI25_9PSEU|nr:hypothetical protein Atai01_45630 [Amycolatopsis taiwanensis]
MRWFLDGTRAKQLAVDNAIGKSTVYDYLDEGFTVLAAQAPARTEIGVTGGENGRAQPRYSWPDPSPASRVGQSNCSPRIA